MSSLSPANDTKLFPATLIQSVRITPQSSPEEVCNLTFKTSDLAFEARTGQCIRVMAPGEYGNRHHVRLYSIAGLSQAANDATEFTLCVRRCFYVDEFSGEEYKGVASNYLCDLRAGDQIEFSGPFGQPFEIPTNKKASLLMIGMGTGIAPFRALVRDIYEKVGNWEGKVRLYYGASKVLEMLYMNDENKDLANYFDQKTFKAFQAISPRPALEVPVALDKALEANATEVWGMLQEPDTRVFVAGAEAMLESVERALSAIAGSPTAWQQKKSELVSSGRWNEVLY